MSTVTSINSAPPVPPWLDLDAIVEPDLRQRIAELIESGTALNAEVEKWCRAALVAMRTHENAVSAAEDKAAVRIELGEAVDGLTGYSTLWSIVQNISDIAGAITGCVGDDPPWVDEVIRQVSEPSSG